MIEVSLNLATFRQVIAFYLAFNKNKLVYDKVLRQCKINVQNRVSKMLQARDTLVRL